MMMWLSTRDQLKLVLGSVIFPTDKLQVKPVGVGSLVVANLLQIDVFKVGLGEFDQLNQTGPLQGTQYILAVVEAENWT